MEGNAPGFWLWAEDCYNDPTWAAAEFSPDGSLFLSQGWKSFACFYHLKRGLMLLFRHDGSGNLFVKFFGPDSCRAKCCPESESSSGPSSSGDSDGDSPAIKREEDSD